jgi:WD40 repeat protein
MGVVYRARQVGLNRVVALKMILAGAHAGPKDLARFRREAEAVAQLHHPNIVQIHDIGEAGGRPYFALELVEGGSLAQRPQGGPQPPRQAAQLIETLARAVHFAHGRGIVHRDLKPANVLLTADGVPKITDFGLAKRLDGQAVATLSGEVVGTPSYMAPEQAGGKDKGQAVGPAADVYALGAILYELLTGRPPFKGGTAFDTVIQVLHNEPARPTRLRPEVPRDLETVCLKCLEKDPGRRYADAEELADDLRRFRRGEAVQARPVGLAERAWKGARRRPYSAALLAGMVLTALLGFAGVTWQWREALAEKKEKESEKLQAEQARNQAVQARNLAGAALYHSRITQSQLHWRLNDFRSALRSLEKAGLPGPGQADLRGWEWYYLRGLYGTELLTLDHRRQGRGGDGRAGTGAVAAHPQRRWVASVLAGQEEVRVWDCASGALVLTLPASATANRLAFRPDGQHLAVADRDGWVTVWDLGARREVCRHRPHNQPISSLVYSPDGRWLATASWDRTVRAWSPLTGKDRYAPLPHADRANSVAFSRSGHRLATADQRGTVRIWDAEKRREICDPLREHKSAVYGLAYSPDGTRLASAGSNGTLRIWDTQVRPPRVVQSVTGNAGAVLSVAFSPDGRFLAYGGSDATVRVWHVAVGVERITFRGHGAPVESVRFTPDGRRLVSCCPEEGAVKVWDLTRHPEHGTLARTHHPEYRPRSTAGTWREVKVWDLLRGSAGPEPEHTGPDVEALAFQDGGRRLVSVTVGGTLQTWEADSGLLLDERSLALGADLISPAVLADFAPGGQRLAARAHLPEGPPEEKDRLVQLWDVNTGREQLVLRGHRLPVFGVRFSPDGRRLATVGCDRSAPGRPHEVLVWDANTGTRLARREGRGHLFSLAFSPDGGWLAVGGEGGQVQVLDWASGKTVLGGAWHTGAVTALAFHARAEGAPLLATTGADDRRVRVKVWDCGSGEARAKLEAPGLLCDLAFSPDGQRLAGICRDQVKLWDVETGQELLTLRGAPQRHRDPAFNPRLAFSPDGLRLAGTNWDESISVWEAEGADRPGRQEARRQAAERRAPLWHLEEAERCARIGNRSAATFHLGWLGESPLPRRLQERKDNLARQLSLPVTKGPR